MISLQRLSPDEFALEGGGGRYHRTIGSGWVNSGDRVFGGYSSALCFAAAASESPHPAICSGHVAFLEPVQPGRIDLEATPLRVGRSVAAMRVEASQKGRRALVCHAWLRPAATVTSAPGAIANWTHPDEGVVLSWLSDVYGFHRLLESRGVDYPSGMSAFAVDGKRSVDVWLRPKGGELPPGAITQLFDVIVADAHISDCQLRGQECDPEYVVSLDLSIQWTPFLHRTGWRRIQATSPPAANGFAACVATIFDETGAICATAAQQAWNVPPRASKVAPTGNEALPTEQRRP